MNTQTAHDFLTRCFQPGETVALLLRKEKPASTTQRIVTLEQATAPRYLAWLRYENHNGANVYVAANPLRSWQPQENEGLHRRSPASLPRHRRRRRRENRCAHGVGSRTRSDGDPLDIAEQVPSAVEGRRLRLRPAGEHPEVAGHRLRRRLRLHRPQPCASSAGIPKLQVRSRAPGHCRIPQRLYLSSRGFSIG